MARKPFDYINSINETKVNLMRNTDNDELEEKDYNPYLTNNALSYTMDTIFFANEVNKNYHLPKRAQYEYLLNSIRPKKRWSKWFKNDKNEDLDIVCEHYNCNVVRGKEYLSLLSKEQIQMMKKQQEKGGRE